MELGRTENLRQHTSYKGRFILANSARVQLRTVGKTWQLECKAAHHTISTIRKQKDMNAGVSLAVSFLLGLEPQPMEQQPTFIPWIGFSMSIFRNAHVDTSRMCSMMTPNLIKLTMKATYYIKYLKISIRRART